MQVFLLRHGQAASHSESGRDEDRPLTDEGREQIAALAKSLAAKKIVFNAIWTSPYRRARETVAVLREQLGSAPEARECLELGSGTSFEEVATLVESYRKENPQAHLLLVGHMPDFGEIAALLLGTRAALDFKPGALFRFALPSSFARGKGKLDPIP